MYIIVVGAGSIGTPLIEIAAEGGNEVVAVKYDKTKAEVAATTFDRPVLSDDAMIRQTPDETSADRADAIIMTTDKDAISIMACLLAKEFDIPDITSVIHNPERMNLYRQIGVSTMKNSQWFTAEYLCRTVKRPSTVNYMCIDEHTEVFEIRVDEDALITGVMIQGAAQEDLLDGNTFTVAVKRGGDNNPVTPRGNTATGAGDFLTVYSAKGAMPEVTGVFGYYEDR